MAQVLADLFPRGVKSGDIKWSASGHLVMLHCDRLSSLSGFLESGKQPLPGFSLCSHVLGANVSNTSALCPRAVGLSQAVFGLASLFGIRSTRDVSGPWVRVREPVTSCFSIPTRHDGDTRMVFF